MNRWQIFVGLISLKCIAKSLKKTMLKLCKLCQKTLKMDSWMDEIS